jgi:hypothetical protein
MSNTENLKDLESAVNSARDHLASALAEWDKAEEFVALSECDGYCLKEAKAEAYDVRRAYDEASAAFAEAHAALMDACSRQYYLDEMAAGRVPQETPATLTDDEEFPF